MKYWYTWTFIWNNLCFNFFICATFSWNINLFKLVISLNLFWSIVLGTTNTMYVYSYGIHFYNDDDKCDDSILIVYFKNDTRMRNYIMVHLFHFLVLLLLGDRKRNMRKSFLTKSITSFFNTLHLHYPLLNLNVFVNESSSDTTIN